MRILSIAAFSLAILLGTSAAYAASVSLGSASIGSAPCSLSGNGADRSCTAGTSGTTILGQASADHGLTTNGTAIADMTINATIPYTVTRNVTIVNPAGPNNNTATFETFDVDFTFTYGGRVGNDNSQLGGGLGNAVAFTASVSSANGYFAAQTQAGGSRIGGTGSVGLSDSDNSSITVTLNFSGAAGELTSGSTLPGDFSGWDDLLPTYHPTTVNGGSHSQSITDTINISFRLRAESRPSGSISTTGGEAIACVGQSSPLGAFDIDNGGGYCGSGYTTTAGISNQGSVVVNLPEPALAALVAAGIGGLWIVRRRRS